MNINDALSMVREFHRHVGAPVADKPCLLPCDPVRAHQVAVQLDLIGRGLLAESDPLPVRAGMAIEELAEWLAAHAKGDQVAAADAWADRAYVLLGDAVCCGLPTAAIFTEVHRSNMTKQPMANCPGKAIKGPGYRPPNIKRVLEEQHE